MSPLLRVLCASAAGVLAASAAGADVSLEVKLATGGQAPGSAPGRILGYVNTPVINDAGELAFVGHVYDPSLDSWGMEIFGPDAAGQPTSIASTFDPAPDLPPDTDFNFDLTHSPRLDDAGTVVFDARLSGPGIDYPENSSGIWRWKAENGLERLARAGDPVPQAGPDAVYGPIGGGHALGSGGVVAFPSSVVDPSDPVGRVGLFTLDGAQTSMLIVEGSPAPGLPGVTLGSVGVADANDHGSWSFSTALAGPGIVPLQNDSASFTWDPEGGVAMHLRGGDPAPGTPPGVVLSSWYGAPVGLNAAGDIARLASLTGPGVDDTNDTALYGPSSSGALSLIAREGSAAPDTEASTVFDSLLNASHCTVINAGGQVAFFANLLGPSVTPENMGGLWRHDAATDTVELLVRQGDAAPELPGLSLADLSCPVLNDRGDVVYYATLAGPGVTPETDRAIFALEGAVVPRKVVREGDLVAFGPGDLRPLVSLWLPNGTGSAVPGAAPLSHNGHLAFHSYTPDGTHAILVATIPEPGFTSGLAAGLVLLATLARSRSRR
ncbi:MAG TPA: choice-of-anchor tandem repeat NxxGxxAF-containing protein [Myxococcota bacterium]|nr:choice-of-anchor tandem repeat NxxGxxAF-containing protein [Myxococcota bacterium]